MDDKILYNDKYCRHVHNYFGSRIKSYSYRLRVRQVLKLIAINNDDKVLEIGANTGELTKELMAYSNNVIGIDINKAAVERAACANIIWMDAQNITFSDNSFSKILSIHVIEHIPDIKKLFKSIDRILAEGGETLFIYPCEIVRGSNAIFDAIKVYKNPFYARKLHIHKITPRKIKKLALDTRLTVIKNGIFWGPFPTFYTVLRKIKIK